MAHRTAPQHRAPPSSIHGSHKRCCTRGCKHSRHSNPVEGIRVFCPGDEILERALCSITGRLPPLHRGCIWTTELLPSQLRWWTAYTALWYC